MKTINTSILECLLSYKAFTITVACAMPKKSSADTWTPQNRHKFHFLTSGTNVLELISRFL